MGKGRSDGVTFQPADIGWLDFESKGRQDIDVGTYRYAVNADAIVAAYAIGDGPPQSVSRLGDALSWDYMPSSFVDHHARVLRGKAVWASWNAGFDRAIWNYATLGFPEMKPQHIIDVMAQATASGLAPNLDMAAKQARVEKKMEVGKVLIALFTLPKSTATPQSHPAEWQQFLAYARTDISAMRGVFRATRQLPEAEWQEYWAAEAINERGVHIDERMVAHAAELAAIDKERSAVELQSLTHDRVLTVDSVQKMQAWLLEQLPDPASHRILMSRAEEVSEDGEVVRPAKYSLTRKKVERLLAYVDAALVDAERRGMALTDAPVQKVLRVRRVLQIRQYGGSKTPAKFRRMHQQQLDGILRGQYVFNGAPQTGRFSSRGVQIHNLARDTLPYEYEAVEALLHEIPYEVFAKFGDNSPVSRKLSLLIRPAFVPGGERVFVGSDWSQIEARVLPWLCDHYAGARDRLQIFREVDADPTLPDLYTRTAAQLSHCRIEEVTKAMRQRGKVAELALGFMGGVGALQAMAAGYGLYFPEDEAKAIVYGWRDANSWAGDFGGELWRAAELARATWKQPVRAGRVTFIYLPDLLGGSLLCRLPSGRCLTYRDIRLEALDVVDDDGEPTGEKRVELTYAKGYGRAKLWPGIFVENVTQATAADFLRGTLVRLEQQAFVTRLHTHDEVNVECVAGNAVYVVKRLRGIMQQGFDWSDGLPLMSEETIGYYYTKNEEAHVVS